MKYGASIGILAWLVVSNREQFQQFQSQDKNLWWMLIALVTMTLAFSISYLRWHQLANAIRLELSVSEAVKLGFIGSFFNVVAFGVVGGDSLRAFYAARRKKDRVPEAILSVFIDRLIGLTVMCGFAGIAWQINSWTGPELAGSVLSDVNAVESQSAIRKICHFAGVCSILGFAGLWLFLFFPGIRNFWLFAVLKKIPKIGELVDRAMEAAALYSHQKTVIVKAIGFSICTNLLFAITIWLVSCSVSQKAPSLLEHFVIAPIAMVANSIPLPGGVGGMEVALTAMYDSYKASGGAIVAICYRLCILFVSLIGWIIWLRFGSEVELDSESLADPEPAG